MEEIYRHTLGELSDLPESLVRILKGKDFSEDTTGRSGARVLLFDDYVLKISPYYPGDEDKVEVNRWLMDKLKVPRVVDYEIEGETQYLLMSRMKGLCANDPRILSDPDRLVMIMAEGLKALWSIPLAGCPKRRTLHEDVEEALYKWKGGDVDIHKAEAFVFGENGLFSDPKDLVIWLYDHIPFMMDPVLCHGDFCPANILVENGHFAGLIDLGEAGVDDRWRDIALAFRGFRKYYDEEWGLMPRPDFDPGSLLAALDLEEDREKLKFFTLLDELF